MEASVDRTEMGQTGTPHGVPLSGNGMSPVTGGLWDLGCCYLFQPRPGGTSEGPRRHSQRIQGPGPQPSLDFEGLITFPHA